MQKKPPLKKAPAARQRRVVKAAAALLAGKPLAPVAREEESPGSRSTAMRLERAS